MDIRRFGAQYRSPAYTHARIKETYETYHDIRYPHHEWQAGRPLRTSPAIGVEHRAARKAVALFDESSFAKLEIEGVGAETFLEVLCDNRVGRENGQITYTQMLNHRGGIECDFTVARLGENRFSIVTGTAFGSHDREWMRRLLPDGDEVQIHDVTSQ